MKIINRSDISKEYLTGRIIQKCVGKQSVSLSKKMTMGFAHYCEETGPMEPHQHAEEIVYIVSTDRAVVRYGKERDGLGDSMILHAGMTLHIPELEWHVFEYETGGYLDIIFFYGQTQNIRPEEVIKFNKEVEKA